MKIIDYQCMYENDAVFSAEEASHAGIHFPEAYLKSREMAKLARWKKGCSQDRFCELPFNHTMEAEALGAEILLGDGYTPPRAGGYVCRSLDELGKLPAMELSQGRIHEVMEACRILAEDGEKVVLDISGPFTIWNSLIDLRYIFRAMRKEPEKIQTLFDKIQGNLVRLLAAGMGAGATGFSYADAAGSLKILGPEMLRQVTECFTMPFLKQAIDILDNRCILLLCPKTTFALLGTEHAILRDVVLDQSLRYDAACMEAAGRIPVLGQMCLKNRGHILKNKILKEVILK